MPREKARNILTGYMGHKLVQHVLMYVQSAYVCTSSEQAISPTPTIA